MSAFVVLYVEDDPVNAQLMQSIAALRPGCELRVAASGGQARVAVQDERFDLLLCDQHLPDADGSALLAELRALGLTAPALLVTAESADEAERLAQQHGFDGCWTKPLDVHAVLREFERWQALRR
ncbi:MAG: response regulator [Roseateles depolymerans]|uniref:Response regulator n=1 Tax=Roseateles depolymerans TaxID=76731 RepID=A0A2W5DPR5_9BURK|nr:MAG: response regulator [Roseateles depolymerans]